MIEAVLFDLDGTLFDRDATVAGILAWQVRAFSWAIAPERAADLFMFRNGKIAVKNSFRRIDHP